MKIKLQLKDISKIPNIYYMDQQIKYKIEDFKILAYAQNKIFLEKNYIDMAKDFIWDYDCNIPENEMMEIIMDNYEEIERSI